MSFLTHLNQHVPQWMKLWYNELYINLYWRNLAFQLIFWTLFNSIVMAIDWYEESLFPDLVCVCSYKYCIIMWHIMWRQQHCILQKNLRIFDRHIPDINIHIIVGDCDYCILSCTVYDIWMYMYLGITSIWYHYWIYNFLVMLWVKY